MGGELVLGTMWIDLHPFPSVHFFPLYQGFVLLTIYCTRRGEHRLFCLSKEAEVRHPAAWPESGLGMTGCGDLSHTLE